MPPSFQTKARFFFSKLSSQADPSGSPMQRFVHYFLQALTARAEGTGYQSFACPVQYNQEVRRREGGREGRKGGERAAGWVETCGVVF